MLKFGGFKAKLNLYSRNKDKEINHQTLSMSGAYRTSKDEYFGYSNLSDPAKISKDVLPKSRQPTSALRPVKSTNDLTNSNKTNNLRKSTPNVSLDPRGEEQIDTRQNKSQKNAINQEKELKKLEKQRLAEQKARDKIAAQEKANQEKLKKEREKKEIKQKEAKQKQAKTNKKKIQTKDPAPQPEIQRANPIPQGSTQYSTNTLESSISRTSGPPPYSVIPKSVTRNISSTNEQVPSSTDNVSFSKPIDTGGNWDMITKHRQQINRPMAPKGGQPQRKQMVMDLKYNLGNQETSQTLDNNNDNSEA